MSFPSSVDVTFVRSVNRRSVLDMTFACGQTSRTKLSEMLSMSKPAVSDNLSGFLDMGIIRETGEGDAAQNGGRKPVILQFNSRYKYIVAVDMNFSNPVFALADLSGNVVQKFDIHISKEVTPEESIEIIKNGINLLVTSSNLSLSDITRIAVAAPGVFDKEGNLVSYNPFYSEYFRYKTNFRDVLRRQFGTCVMIKNDIKAAALGKWVTDESPCESMLYLSCGIGLGAGIILDSRLYEGPRFSAGEIYNDVDALSAQGGGNIEDRVCIKSLVGRCRAGAESGECRYLADAGGEIDFDAVLRAYAAKDGYVVSVVTGICEELGMLALNYMNFLSFDRLILGGEYAAFGDTFIDRFRELYLPRCLYKPSVDVDAQGENSGIQGLVAIARDQFFSEICSGDK